MECVAKTRAESEDERCEEGKCVKGCCCLFETSLNHKRMCREQEIKFFAQDKCKHTFKHTYIHLQTLRAQSYISAYRGHSVPASFLPPDAVIHFILQRYIHIL